MVTEREVELGILAYDAYLMGRVNLVPLAGWARRDAFDRNDPETYFGAAVYTKGDEVVISFRGTDTPQSQDFLGANIPIGLGRYSHQVRQAIELVSDAMQMYGGNVTFTGHSLGGGLASLVSAFFNKPAVIFDPAPFAYTAQSKSVNVIVVPPLVPTHTMDTHVMLSIRSTAIERELVVPAQPAAKATTAER